MTRIIAFASLLLLLPLVYMDYQGMAYASTTASVFRQVAENPRELVFWLVLGYPLLIVSGHFVWLTCRAFNFVMRKLA